MTAVALPMPAARRKRVTLRRFLAQLIIALLVIWTGVPLFISFRPRWWLEINCVLTNAAD